MRTIGSVGKNTPIQAKAQKSSAVKQNIYQTLNHMQTEMPEDFAIADLDIPAKRATPKGGITIKGRQPAKRKGSEQVISNQSSSRQHKAVKTYF